MNTRSTLRRRTLLSLSTLALLVGCTAPDATDNSSSSAASSSDTAVAPPSASAASSSTPTSVTQPGMLTGPGVDDVAITLGSLVDDTTDRGFRQGLELWRNSVNAAGGVCGRSVTLASSGADGVPTELPDAYRALGAQVLGFVTETQTIDVRSELSSLLSADQVPALTVDGTAADLAVDSPVVIGPTADIVAINAIDQLVQLGVIIPGDTIGMVLDGSPMALNAAAGLRWYAKRNSLALLVQTVDGRDASSLATLPLVVSLGDPQLTADLAAALPASTVVLTTLDGYDPALLPTGETTPVDVALSTPAAGSDEPGVRALEAALDAVGETPGARTFAGYASGATWQRLLEGACDAQSLTRAGVQTALGTVGAASLDSVLGASDPGLPGESKEPATRSSALAAADPTASSGLRPLTGLIVADGIGDYLAGVP